MAQQASLEGWLAWQISSESTQGGGEGEERESWKGKRVIGRGKGKGGELEGENDTL